MKEWYFINKHMLSVNFIINMIKEKIENKQYTNNLDILMCQTLGFDELAKKCQTNKNAILQKREKEREKERAEQKQEQTKKELQYQQEQQEQAKQQLETAKQKMYSGEYITNIEFEILCKYYKVTTSIKFIGWLRTQCGNIKIIKQDNSDEMDFNYRTTYYYNKGHKSTSIYNYANALAIAMGI